MRSLMHRFFSDESGATATEYARLIILIALAIGGGDAKLIAGATLLVGYHDLFAFLFLMSLCGGVLALAVLGQHRIRPWLQTLALSVAARQKPGGWVMRHSRLSAALTGAADSGQPAKQLSVPYGVAIAAAGIITLGLQTVPPQLFL